MDKHLRSVVEKRVARTAEALTRNNMEVHCLESRKDVIPALTSLLRQGEVVAHGGSMTLAQCSVPEWLKTVPVTYLDRDMPGLSPADRQEMMRRALLSDTYLTSVNAILEEGALYLVDGNGNRAAAMLYGPRRVIVVAGVNKIVSSLSEAVARVRTIACPANVALLERPTWCRKQGHCIAFDHPDGGKIAGCGRESICNDFVLLRNQTIPGRIQILLVMEDLGY